MFWRMLLPRRKRTVFWVVAVFLLGKAYDTLVHPILALNVEKWAESYGLDNELVDGAEQSMPVAQWLLIKATDIAVTALGYISALLASQWFFGFACGALIFAAWERDWFRRTRGPSRVGINETPWWTGRRFLTVRELAAVAADTTPTKLEDSELGRSILRQVLADARAHKFPTHASPSTMGGISVEINEHQYARHDEHTVSEDSFVPMSFVLKYLSRNKYPANSNFVAMQEIELAQQREVRKAKKTEQIQRSLSIAEKTHFADLARPLSKETHPPLVIVPVIQNDESLDYCSDLAQALRMAGLETRIDSYMFGTDLLVRGVRLRCAVNSDWLERLSAILGESGVPNSISLSAELDGAGVIIEVGRP